MGNFVEFFIQPSALRFEVRDGTFNSPNALDDVVEAFAGSGDTSRRDRYFVR